MNWINSGFNSDGEEEAKATSSENGSYSSKIFEENEQKKHLRLEQVKDPSKDENRKAYIAIASKFGELLLTNNYEAIVKSLMTEDCEVFLFNFGEIVPVKYSLKPQEFSSVYQGGKVIKREVKESNVDSEAATAFQICYCEILNEQDQTIIPQFSLEVFSFRDDKISKYRASFGSSVSFDEFKHPFNSSQKEKMLAKVKQFTYAWAEKPDLERIASFLDPSTEYKFWRWEDQKSFTFDRNNFAENFNKSLEENYVIDCVVPYHVYSEAQYIMSNYVFHLEGKNKSPGEKFMWFSTCIYTFDKYLNITKINQQGEFYRQDEIEIPFQVFQNDQIRQKIGDFYSTKEKKKSLTFLDSTDLAFSIELCKFGPKPFLAVDHVKGFHEYTKLSKVFQERGGNYEWDKVVDFFVDRNDGSYDTAFSIECLKRSKPPQNEGDPAVEMNLYTAKKFYFENGKVARIALFFSHIPEVIPSPYDDQTFTMKNIKPKKSFTV